MISVGDHKWMNTPAPVAGAPIVGQCGDCRHFEHDAINPCSGLGYCRGARNGDSMYPSNNLQCIGWKHT